MGPRLSVSIDFIIFFIRFICDHTNYNIPPCDHGGDFSRIFFNHFETFLIAWLLKKCSNHVLNSRVLTVKDMPWQPCTQLLHLHFLKKNSHGFSLSSCAHYFHSDSKHFTMFLALQAAHREGADREGTGQCSKCRRCAAALRRGGDCG